MKRVTLLLFVLGCLSLSGCWLDSSDDGDSSSNPGAGNTLPVASAGADRTVNEQAEVTLDGSASRDPDGSVASYRWEQKSGPTVVLDNAAASKPKFTAPTLTQAQVLRFELQVTDDDGGVAADTVEITVNPVNQAPSADAGVDQEVTSGSQVTLDGSGSADSDGAIASYVWQQIEGDAVVLSDNGAVSPTFAAPALGTEAILAFELTVTDNEGSTAVDGVEIRVLPAGTPPVADAGNDQAVDAGTLVTLNGSGSSDADGTIASYAWNQIGGPAVVLNNASSSAPAFMAPTVTAAEVLSFQVQVTDNDGLSATDSVQITVSPPAVDGVPSSEMEDAYTLNQLYFEYGGLLGTKVWVLGFYGNQSINEDGAGFLVDNMLRLEVDEKLPHHSFARIDGQLPPEDWQGAEIAVYGEVLDFGAVYGVATDQPTPLVRVEKVLKLADFQQNNSWENSYLPPDQEAAEPQLMASQVSLLQALEAADAAPVVGTQAVDCDRSVIISGGVDASNNHARYVDNVIAKYNKMKELGFDDGQIEIFYNDGAAIEVGGNDVVDDKTTNAKLKAHFDKLAEEMPGSCTLTLFVTDHGTGYNQEQGYEGARPALSGSEATSGRLYDENTFIFDARAKTYRTTTFEHRGKMWLFSKDGLGKVRMYKRVAGKWVFKGEDGNGNGTISETELSGEDLNGDGDGVDGNYGFRVSVLEGRLGDLRHSSNEWDTDGNGAVDVRLRWDGVRYVVERLVQGQWQEMGRDSNGDLFIDIIDGGVDWNLDGDKADQVGFHEGINLWGSEVLWDDAFADLLKPLADKGVHIMVEMVSCFSGGLVPNIKDLVENVYAGSAEDTKHYNRLGADHKYFAADEMAFLNNLAGIDSDSWSAAAAAATAADDALATTQNATKNVHVHEQTAKYVTESVYQAGTGQYQYNLLLDLPDELVGDIYDFEFILGLQKPRWNGVEFHGGLPDGLQVEAAPGGIRVFSFSPIADRLVIPITVDGIELGAEDKIRVEFTDIDHQRLGYTVASPGQVTTPELPMINLESVIGCVNHTDHGQSSPSIIEWLFVATAFTGLNPEQVLVTLRVTTPSGSQTVSAPLSEVFKVYVLFNIFTFGSYSFEVLGAVYMPTSAALQVGGQTMGTLNVTSLETNKGQCAP